MWERIKIPEPTTPHDELERPFTDEEVRKLLTGPASPAMHDLMMIAALTGARLEAIVDLRARDCEAGIVHVQATEEGEVRQRGADPFRAR